MADLIPVIDVSDIERDELNVADEITRACAEWGFFLIRGHNIPAARVREMFAWSREFFEQDEATKEPYGLNGKNVGYVGSFKDRAKDDKMSMWFGGPSGRLAQSEAAIPPFWRDRLAEVEAFKHDCYQLGVQLLRCCAISLGLEADTFTAGHREDMDPGSTLRLLYYPARDAPTQSGRMSQHADTGSVTLLFQTCPGLEVQSPTGQWVRAPAPEDHILINIGDALKLWSGNRLKATLHRVTTEGLPYNRMRQTMAYFLAANADTVLKPVFPIEGPLLAYDGSPIPESITAGQYNKMVMERIYGTRKD